jgi:hypothetical protein
MSEGHRNFDSSSTSLKNPSPKIYSPNGSTPVAEFTSNREQKKSEERQGPIANERLFL